MSGGILAGKFAISAAAMAGGGHVQTIASFLMSRRIHLPPAGGAAGRSRARDSRSAAGATGKKKVAPQA